MRNFLILANIAILIGVAVTIIVSLSMRLWEVALVMTYILGSCTCLVISYWLFTPCDDINREVLLGFYGLKESKEKTKTITYFKSKKTDVVAATVIGMSLNDALASASISEGGSGCCLKVMTGAAGRLCTITKDPVVSCADYGAGELVQLSNDVKSMVTFNGEYICSTGGQCNTSMSGLLDQGVHYGKIAILVLAAYIAIKLMIKIGDSVVKKIKAEVVEDKNKYSETKYIRRSKTKIIMYVVVCITYGALCLALLPNNVSVSAECIFNNDEMAVQGFTNGCLDAGKIRTSDNGFEIDAYCLRGDVMYLSRSGLKPCCKVGNRVIYNPEKCREMPYSKGSVVTNLQSRHKRETEYKSSIEKVVDSDRGSNVTYLRTYSNGTSTRYVLEHVKRNRNKTNTLRSSGGYDSADSKDEDVDSTTHHTKHRSHHGHGHHTASNNITAFIIGNVTEVIMAPSGLYFDISGEDMGFAYAFSNGESLCYPSYGLAVVRHCSKAVYSRVTSNMLECGSLPLPSMWVTTGDANNRAWGVAGERTWAVNSLTRPGTFNIYVKSYQDSLQSGSSYIVRSYYVRLTGNYVDTQAMCTYAYGMESSSCGSMLQDTDFFVRDTPVVRSPTGTKGDFYQMTHTCNLVSNQDGSAEFVIKVVMGGDTSGIVKIFGETIDVIRNSGQICNRRGSVRINGICYHDESGISSGLLGPAIGPETQTFITGTHQWGSSTIVAATVRGRAIVGTAVSEESYNDIGRSMYFSSHGWCNTVLTDHDGLMTCNGSMAFLSSLIEMRLPLVEEVPSGNCGLRGNVYECRFTTNVTSNHCVKEKGKRTSCRRLVGRDHSTIVPNTGLTYMEHRLSGVMIQSNADSRCEDFKEICEAYHRCRWCMILMWTLLGIGYWAILIILIAIIICFINSYNLGRLGRKMRLNYKWLYSSEYETMWCYDCESWAYGNVSKTLHKFLCNRRICTRCRSCEVKDGKKVYYSIKCETMDDLRMHTKMHTYNKINRVAGVIYILKAYIVAFVVIYVGQVNAQEISTMTGLRSNRIGDNITIIDTILSCNNNECAMSGDEEIRIPITDGASVMFSGRKENRDWRRKVTIKNPAISTTCSFKYISGNVLTQESRIGYVCYGKPDCSSQDHYLYNSMRSGSDNIPWNMNNPRKSAYCPISSDCISPLVDVFWLSAGCVTVHDGGAVAFETFHLDRKKQMIGVFECKIDSVDYDVCTEAGCKAISSHGVQIADGRIDFEHKEDGPIPTEFQVGVALHAGDDNPQHLFWNPPKLAESTDNTVFAYRTTGIARDDLCIPGASFNGGNCRIDTYSGKPNINCRDRMPVVDMDSISHVLDTLGTHVHCNSEGSVIRWTNNSVVRNFNKGEVNFIDTLVYDTPLLELSLVSCNLGYTTVRTRDLASITLIPIVNTRRVTSSKCTGEYNRNGMAKISIELGSGIGGMGEVMCGEGVSKDCSLDTSRYNSCNVTVILNSVYDCTLGESQFKLDCRGLTILDPDYISGKIIGPSGSDRFDTWELGFMKFLTTWYGVAIISIVCILFILILVGVVVAIYKNCISTESGYVSLKKLI